MAGVIFFKFKTGIASERITFDGSFISVGELKRLIAEKKKLGNDDATELVLSDPRSGEDYLDESQQLPRNTSVQVRRAPVVKAGALQPKTVTATPQQQQEADVPQATPVDEDFEGDLFADKPVTALNEDDDALLKMLEGKKESWQQEVAAGVAMGRGRGRGRGRGGVLPKVPPPHLPCERCGKTGHWNWDCPDKDDVKRVRAPVGIPVTRLAPNSAGGLVLPGGQVGSLLANEDAFAREMASMPTIVGTGGGGGVAEAEAPSKQPETTPPPQEVTPQTDGVEAMQQEAVGEQDRAQPTDAMHDQEHTEPPPEEPTPDDTNNHPVEQPTTTRPSSSSPATTVFTVPLPRRLLPAGPPDAIMLAFDRAAPLTKAEFHTLQDETRAKYGYVRMRRTPSPSRRRHTSRSPAKRSRSPAKRSRRSRSRGRRRRSRSKEGRSDSRDGDRHRRRSKDDRRDKEGRSKDAKDARASSKERRRRSRSPSGGRKRSHGKDDDEVCWLVVYGRGPKRRKNDHRHNHYDHNHYGSLSPSCHHTGTQARTQQQVSQPFPQDHPYRQGGENG